MLSRHSLLTSPRPRFQSIEEVARARIQFQSPVRQARQARKVSSNVYQEPDSSPELFDRDTTTTAVLICVAGTVMTAAIVGDCSCISPKKLVGEGAPTRCIVKRRSGRRRKKTPHKKSKQKKNTTAATSYLIAWLCRCGCFTTTN